MTARSLYQPQPHRTLNINRHIPPLSQINIHQGQLGKVLHKYLNHADQISK